MACLLETTNEDQMPAPHHASASPLAEAPASTSATPDGRDQHRTVDDDDDDNDDDAYCMVCWEPTSDDGDTHQRATAWTMLPCHHGACHACLFRWIERCEGNGHDDATCPHCRHVMDASTIQGILGRPYEYQLQPTEPQAVTTDDFTQTWLDDHAAHPCDHCGMYQTRDDDGDEDGPPVTACLCGYIYCWECQEDGTSCDCNHYEFYDYIVGHLFSMEEADDYPVATEEDLRDLGAFMARRKAVLLGGREDSDAEEEEKEEEEEEEEEEASADHTSQTEAVVEASSQQQQVVEEPAYGDEAVGRLVAPLFQEAEEVPESW